MTANATMVPAGHKNAKKGKLVGFTPFTAVCFTLNYTIGTGFLVLPWAFHRGGLILSTITMIGSSVIADLCASYVLETMARAAAAHDGEQEKERGDRDEGNEEEKLDGDEYNESSMRVNFNSTEKYVLDLLVGIDNGERMPMLMIGEGRNDPCHPQIVAESTKANESYQSLAQRGETIATGGGGGAPIANDESFSSELLFITDDRRFETTTLCEIYLGPWGSRSYTFSLATYLYLVTWAYSSVFALAVATLAPIPMIMDDPYPVYVVVFAAIVIPMTLRDLEDQRVVQVFLTVCKVTRMILMIGTALLSPSGSFAPEERDNDDPNIPWVLWSGFFQMLPVVVVTTIFHMAVPDLSYPVGDKAALRKVFFWAVGIAAVVYSAVGASAGWRFGDHVNESANLNWSSYHGLPDGSHDIWWLHVGVSYFVVSSPILDVVSGFPLNAITLANNLVGLYLGASRHASNGKVSRKVKTVSRFMAALPPLIAALLVRDLGVVTRFAGVCGIAIMFCFPSLLFLRSGAMADRKGLRKDTFYRTFASSISWARSIFLLGIGMMMMVFAQLFTETWRSKSASFVNDGGAQ